MSLYDVCHDHGGMTRHAFKIDPKRLGFILARYKFVAKMFAGMDDVLEIGCADGIGSHVVAQSVGQLTAIDSDARSIDEAGHNDLACDVTNIARANYDFIELSKSLELNQFNGVFALDVLEHIPLKQEYTFLRRMSSVAPVAIIGMPSLESQEFASALSREGHVNCKTEAQLRQALHQHWSNVFLFGMNDETLHTGFGPMCQYRLALCVNQ
jgi:2-polyprenyl-3-methyl-5-hydroxy-6-metoxy-1,4-benzoquinol methylase